MTEDRMSETRSHRYKKNLKHLCSPATTATPSRGTRLRAVNTRSPTRPRSRM